MATATRKSRRRGKDATAELIERFSDPAAWDHVEERVPIFVEHEAWEVTQADGSKTLRMVLPGQDKPTSGRMLYAVDAEKIRATAKNIQQNLDDYRKPIKLFIGHSDPRNKQEDNPDIIGYGVGADVGTWGPTDAAAIFTKTFYKPGTFDEASKYPERSPEYFPGRDVITGLALLKTDPRLPMGMLPYGERDDLCVCYGQGFDPPEDTSDETDDSDPTVNPAESADDAPTDDAPAPDDAPPEQPGEENEGDLELSPEEAQVAMKYMSHYERHHPVIKYACEQFRKMQESAPPAGAAPAVASPTNGSLPGSGDEEKKDMAITELPVQYAERIQKLEAANLEHQVRYANEAAARTVQTLVHEGYRIKDPKKLRERMAKLDDAGRKDLAAEIRENYAQDEKPPVRSDDNWIAAGDSPAVTHREPTTDEMNQVVRYAEEHELNLENDAEYRQACAAVIGK